jgi:hypothetical protein
MNLFAAINKLLGWLLYFIDKNTDKETIKCKQCKGVMTSNEQYLALLPLRFDESHDESAAYYLNHTTPIESEDEIPTGCRACYINVFRCGSCSNKVISVIDFLKVRDEYLIKGGDTYPYEDFRAYIENRA